MTWWLRKTKKKKYDRQKKKVDSEDDNWYQMMKQLTSSIWSTPCGIADHQGRRNHQLGSVVDTCCICTWRTTDHNVHHNKVCRFLPICPDTLWFRYDIIEPSYSPLKYLELSRQWLSAMSANETERVPKATHDLLVGAKEGTFTSHTTRSCSKESALVVLVATLSIPLTFRKDRYHQSCHRFVVEQR